MSGIFHFIEENPPKFLAYESSTVVLKLFPKESTCSCENSNHYTPRL